MTPYQRPQALTCQQTRPGSARTRQRPETFGNQSLQQVDSKGLPLAEFEAEPQPCLPDRSHSRTIGIRQMVSRAWACGGSGQGPTMPAGRPSDVGCHRHRRPSDCLDEALGSRSGRTLRYGPDGIGLVPPIVAAAGAAVAALSSVTVGAPPVVVGSDGMLAPAGDVAPPRPGDVQPEQAAAARTSSTSTPRRTRCGCVRMAIPGQM